VRLNFGTDLRTVEVGHRFRHRRIATRGAIVVETAHVVGRLDDHSGIPHIQFMVSIKRINRIIEDGPRTLSLSTFVRYYNEDV
jgi:hypothetical protein